MNTPKRHHFVPVFYLRGFAAANGQLWIFDREEREYRQQDPKDTAVEKGYYAFEDEDGKKQWEPIERILGVVDNDTAPIVSAIGMGKLPGGRDKEILATFVALQKTRVPEFEKATNEIIEKSFQKLSRLAYANVNFAKAELEQYERATGNKLDISPEEVVKIIQGDDWEVEVPRESSLEHMLKFMPAFMTLFIQMDWHFLQAPAGEDFVTSDNPFMLLPPSRETPLYGVGLCTPGAQKVIPLSRRTCLVIADRGSVMEYRQIDHSTLQQVNALTAANSDRFLIGHDKALLESLVVETKIDQWRRGERIKISG